MKHKLGWNDWGPNRLIFFVIGLMAMYTFWLIPFGIAIIYICFMDQYW